MKLKQRKTDRDLDKRVAFCISLRVPIRSGSAVVSREFLCSGIQLKTHLPLSSPQSFD